jgi:hypothetical protein
VGTCDDGCGHLIVVMPTGVVPTGWLKSTLQLQSHCSLALTGMPRCHDTIASCCKVHLLPPGRGRRLRRLRCFSIGRGMLFDWGWCGRSFGGSMQDWLSASADGAMGVVAQTKQGFKMSEGLMIFCERLPWPCNGAVSRRTEMGVDVSVRQHAR